LWARVGEHRADGDLLHILTLSLGSAGGDANVRVHEALRAAELLGAAIDFGNLPDCHISEGIETIDLIQAAILRFRPTHVYTHSLEDAHQGSPGGT
jgi:LmbE family N-acetylglucosaminyl deacetylase